MPRQARTFAVLLWLACSIFAAQLVICAHAAQASPRSRPRHATQRQYEQILDYDSQIDVHSDGGMVVTETIRVVSTQQQIRHGIYRDFPTEYTDRLGNRYVVGFDLVGATRDGEAETTRLQDLSNGKRIYLGRSDTLVPAGEHTYTITYTTSRQLGFFKDHDELFWNVTGNGWLFWIQHASATVHLPNNIPASKVHLGGYTGPRGSMATDLTTSVAADGGFQFETTRPLPTYSGLTILLTFPKGYFAEPTTAERIRYFVEDNRASAIALVGFSLILVYYVAVWAYAGRDPKAGAIVVQYDPPANFSPAAIRYLVRMGFDNKAFAAAVIDMAVRGFITIKLQAGSYTLYRTKADSSVLSPDEKTIADKLFNEGRTEIWLHNENHTTISGAIAALRRWLKTAEQKIYFVTNSSYMLPAILLSALMLVAIVSSQGAQKMGMAAFICVWLSMWSIGVFALVATAVHLWKAAFEGGTGRAGAIGQAVFISLFGLPFVGGEIFGLWFFTQATSAATALILVGTIVVHLVFHHLLKAPTRAGRTVLDKIEGFKRFLGAVEGDRMNRIDVVDRTPEVFEKFLPYALSLDVEHAWAANFAGVLQTAGAAPSDSGGGTYSPMWYSGGDWASLGATALASSLAGSFSSAIASSATAPGGSSGGGGGGGGSGGGGGGGGGGGW
jgi:uncharacterized membrane protein YgcG